MDPNISEKDYRALPIESYSSLKYLLDSPDDFKYYKANPFKGSTATLLGTSIHHYLQGNRHLVAIAPMAKGPGKALKEAYEKFVGEFRDLTGEDGIIVPASFGKTLESIAKSLDGNPKVQKLLENCKFEVPIAASYGSLQFKAKLDGVGEDYVLEIKSSSQATTATEFKEEAIQRHYDLQAAMYLHAANKSKHYFIVVNTVAPFKVEAYKTSSEMILSGQKKLKEIAYAYEHYIVNGESYSYDDYEEC